MELFSPVNSKFIFAELKMEPEGELITRNLTDMDWMFTDQKTVEKLIKEDPQIYRYYNVDIPEKKGHLQHCISIINPGKIGKEYYMTKGHFHERKDTAEVYYTIQGQGKLLLQSVTDSNPQVQILDMAKGILSYVPPYWAHRCVNIGDEELVFAGIYPGDAGHIYGEIEEKGFAKLVVDREGRPEIVDNLKYTRE